MVTESNSKLSGIILAGGQSSRMGRDKALLPIEGIPLLQRVCNVAIALCHPVYVVTPLPEHYEDLIPPGCQLLQEVPWHNENQGDINSSSTKVTLPLRHGPLIGFAQGLAQVQTEWVLLLACDLPKLQLEVLQDWARGLDNVGEEAIALLPLHAKGWEPLCGFYRRSCLPALIEYINQGGRSFQHWLRQHQVQVLPLNDAQMLFNCNTPADLEAF